MKKRLRTVLQKIESVNGFYLYAAALLLSMAGAYSLLAARLGFYYDDWEGVFLYSQGFSPRQVWEYFLVDRPFSSIAHWLFHPLLGVSPLGWNILVLLLHWAAVLFLVKSLAILFPKSVLAIGWTGLLLALYPGITRHFVPRTSTPHYLSLFLFTLSLWLMLKAYQNPKRQKALLAVSIICALGQVLIIEYFATMELARFFIISYFFHQRDERNRRSLWRQTILAWLPYGLVFVVFAVFKFSILPILAQSEALTPKHSIGLWQQFLSAPLETITLYANLIVQDGVHAVLYVWTLPIVPGDIDLASTTVVVSWLLGAALAVLSAVAILIWQQQAGEPTESPDGKLVAGLCLIVLLLGGLPAWLIGRQAITGTWSNRFLFAQALGAVPLLVITVLALTGSARRRTASIVFAALLMASFSLQFREAQKYTLYWAKQQNFYWQLKWRAPGLTPKTFIVSPSTPLPKNSSYQIAFVINMLYAPGHAENDSLHWWFNGPEDLWDFKNQKYPPAKEIQAGIRDITFESNMRLALPVLYQPGRGCMQVPTDDYYQGEPGLSEAERRLFALVHQDLIRPQGPPMPAPFQKEPAHTWCYYYQKAELARQLGNWEEILSLWQSANTMGYAAVYGPEYLPFIEAHARNGNWVEARRISVRAGKISKDARPFLCTFWVNHLHPLAQNGDFETEWNKTKTALDCP